MLVCLALIIQKKIRINGSKLLAKGVLDSGSTPLTSTNYGGVFGFDRASNNLKATREATDAISAKTIIAANDDYFGDIALAA